MKFIQNRDEVAVCHGADEVNNNKSLTIWDSFETEPGFFDDVVRPMLQAGQERQLTEWLKQIGLIPLMQKCKNATRSECCSVPMTWTPAKIPDHYQWKCLGCSFRKNIRENTIFCNVKCKFGEAIKVLLGWCKGMDQETVTRMLDLKRPAVRALYSIANRTAERHIRTTLQNFKLGGPGVVVVVDTFPDVSSNIAQVSYTMNARPVLCIAEIKSIPTKFWLEVLDRYDVSNFAEMDYINDRALRIVQQVVHPGSIIVGNPKTAICSYYDLVALCNYYPVIVSTEAVSKHDTALQSLVDNLQVIWNPIVEVCQQAQSRSVGEVQGFMYRYMWRQRYRDQSFQELLRQFLSMSLP